MPFSQITHPVQNSNRTQHMQTSDIKPISKCDPDNGSRTDLRNAAVWPTFDVPDTLRYFSERTVTASTFHVLTSSGSPHSHRTASSIKSTVLFMPSLLVCSCCCFSCSHCAFWYSDSNVFVTTSMVVFKILLTASNSLEVACNVWKCFDRCSWIYKQQTHT